MGYLYPVTDPQNIKLAFGRVLKSKRDELGLSQEKLAEYAELERTFISWLETGKKQATLTTIFKVSSALKLRSSELMGLVEDEIAKGDNL
jgi:transcriptional regulator with XRE-family HTH domain